MILTLFLLPPLSQAMTPLLQSASFFLVRFIERFKLIPSSVPSSFHQAFQAYSFLSDAIEAGSLLVRAYYTHVAGLVPFVPTTRM